MTRDEITRLALRDAENETLDNLRSAAGILDGLTGRQAPSVLVQNDIWGTPLPNGMLRWFGFDFDLDQADLPSDPLLHRDNPPRWVGTPQGDMHIGLEPPGSSPSRRRDPRAWDGGIISTPMVGEGRG